MQVTIAGSGGWGTALAILLHENGHDVTLWSHFKSSIFTSSILTRFFLLLTS